MSTEAHYLVNEKEADLLAAVLLGCTEKHTADRILCDLIELGLVDMDRGPTVYQAWVEAAEADEHMHRQHLIDLYLQGEVDS